MISNIIINHTTVLFDGCCYIYMNTIKNLSPYFIILLSLTIFFSDIAKADMENDLKILPDIIQLKENADNRIGIFFSSQNDQKLSFIKEILSERAKEKLLITKDDSKKIYFYPTMESPVIEFKKINPTKYRVHVHGAIEDFPLIFSESYHGLWKMYIMAGIDKFCVDDLSFLDNYYLFDGNEEDQATKDELIEFLEKGWVSTLGDELKYKQFPVNKNDVGLENNKNKIGFISKNIRNTIQNNNLAYGTFYETWFETPISENFHWMANGYANAWWIKLSEIKKRGKYNENTDGSISFELIVEFWPQKMLYVGFFISGIILFSCIIFIGLSSFRYKSFIFSRK